MDELDSRIERLERLAKDGSRSNSSASNINIHAGGIGVIVSAFCCVLMLVMCLFGMNLINQQNDEIRDLKTVNREFQYQFNSIYSRYPYLKQEQAK